MPQHAAADVAASNRRRGQAADGVSFWHTLYLGTSRYNMAPGAADPPAGALFPMAFLVEQDPGSTASAHFHQADQFQVVVAGNGTLGLHAVAPLTVHFTAAHTAYGPIRAGAEGVAYFTLRNGFDPGARFMSRPENRAALRSIRDRLHREAVAGPLPAAAADREVLIGPDPDGMAAWRHRLAPGDRLRGSDPAEGRGQYWLVCDGSLVMGEEILPRLSCIFVRPDEPAFEAVAGPDGLEILALQFPRRPNA